MTGLTCFIFLVCGGFQDARAVVTQFQPVVTLNSHMSCLWVRMRQSATLIFHADNLALVERFQLCTSTEATSSKRNFIKFLLKCAIWRTTRENHRNMTTVKLNAGEVDLRPSLTARGFQDL